MRSREEKARITESLLGTPFKSLPGQPRQYKVLGECRDGTKIKAMDVEMVMNDAWMMDAVEGAGYYKKSYGWQGKHAGKMLEIYELAVRLYGCEPVDLHGGKVGPGA